MATNEAADALGALSISEEHEIEAPSTPRASRDTHNEDTGDESETASNSSGSTIRPSSLIVRPRNIIMSKSKSADELHSHASMMDDEDVFSSGGVSTSAQPSESNAVVRQGDQSVDVHAQQYHPRADRGTEINEYNAQGQLPPEAAIFCANLSNTLSAQELAASVHRAFDVYGKCYVSVKYDKHHNPYAVIQYETSEAAREALRSGNYTMLDGRQVRLEQSKGDRALLISVMDGSHTVTEHEAREVLSKFGEIETIMSTDMIPGRSTTLRGQYVRFAYFLDCRDALRKLSDPNTESPYRIQLAAGLEPKRRIGPAGSEIYTSLGPARTNTDSKSIYVGNLPEDCTDNDVHTAFARFGIVENINLVRKTYPGGALNCFAFVEFASPADAETAYQTEMWIQKNKLRIEPKEYTARRNQRMAFESPPSQRYDRSSPMTPPSQRRGYGWGSSSGGQQRTQSPPRQRVPLRISPAASAALQERLAENNYHNSALTAPAAPRYGDPMSSPPPAMMMSPPRFNPYGGGAGYHAGSPEAYRGHGHHYESPPQQANYYPADYHHRGGMMGHPPEGYTDPGYMAAAAPQYNGPAAPPPGPNYPPYDPRSPGRDHQ